MTLSYKIDWDNGLVKNKEFLCKEKMWEKSFGENSTFYRYFTQTKYDFQKITTFQCFEGDELVGLLIFPELPSEVIEMKIRGKKRKFFSLGEIQIYIKENHRKKGVASKMVREFDQLLYDKIKDEMAQDVVYVLQATQRAVIVAERNMKSFPVYDVFGIFPELLRDKIRNDMPYNNNKVKTMKEWKEFNYIPYLMN